MTNRMDRATRGMARRLVYLAVFALLSLCLPGVARAQWTTGGTNISNTNTGNVGIGTTQPVQRLDVRGNLILDSGTSPYLYTGTGRTS